MGLADTWQIIFWGFSELKKLHRTKGQSKKTNIGIHFCGRKYEKNEMEAFFPQKKQI